MTSRPINSDVPARQCTEDHALYYEGLGGVILILLAVFTLSVIAFFG